MNLLAKFFANLGLATASMGSSECFVWLADEPKMPKSLIEK